MNLHEAFSDMLETKDFSYKLLPMIKCEVNGM